MVACYLHQGGLRHVLYIYWIKDEEGHEHVVYQNLLLQVNFLYLDESSDCDSFLACLSCGLSRGQCLLYRISIWLRWLAWKLQLQQLSHPLLSCFNIRSSPPFALLWKTRWTSQSKTELHLHTNIIHTNNMKQLLMKLKVTNFMWNTLGFYLTNAKGSHFYINIVYVNLPLVFICMFFNSG